MEQRFLPPDPQGQFPFEVRAYLFNLLVAVKEARDDEVERVIRPLGVSRQAYRVLLTIQRFAPCGMSDLAVVTSIDRTTLTRIIDRLCEDGLVDRGDHEGDRRRVVMALTPKGSAVTADAEGRVAEMGNQALAALRDEEQRAMVACLHTLLGQFGSARAEMDRVFAARWPQAEG